MRRVRDMYAVVGLGLSGTMTTSIYNGLDETDYDHCDCD